MMRLTALEGTLTTAAVLVWHRYFNLETLMKKAHIFSERIIISGIILHALPALTDFVIDQFEWLRPTEGKKHMAVYIVSFTISALVTVVWFISATEVAIPLISMFFVIGFVCRCACILHQSNEASRNTCLLRSENNSGGSLAT